ncbi:DUF6082 family protein [Streptomyces sp. NPDC059373]
MSAIDRRRAERALRFLGLGLLATAVCVLMSIAMTLVPDLRSQGSGNAGQAYGAVASSSAVLVLFLMAKTLRLQREETSLQRQELELQREEMRLQRIELELQREEMRRSAGELHRSAEAELRGLHMQLLKMSIDDPDLAEVWPPLAPGLSFKRSRQYSYANLIYAHLLLGHSLGTLSDREALGHMRSIAATPVFREYWAAARAMRDELEPGSQEHRFATLVDEAVMQIAALTPDLHVVDEPTG